jgi:hypothetical protein
MGASSFIVRSKGYSADNAFREAIREAKCEFGSGGYTGSIAEKHSFVVLQTPDDLDAEEYAVRLLDSDDRRVSDKWGPAGCLALSGGEFLFFGYSSC